MQKIHQEVDSGFHLYMKPGRADFLKESLLDDRYALRDSVNCCGLEVHLLSEDCGMAPFCVKAESRFLDFAKDCESDPSLLEENLFFVDRLKYLVPNVFDRYPYVCHDRPVEIREIYLREPIMILRKGYGKEGFVIWGENTSIIVFSKEKELEGIICSTPFIDDDGIFVYPARRISSSRMNEDDFFDLQVLCDQYRRRM